MPKEEILTGPAVIKIVSTYMGPEHVELHHPSDSSGRHSG